MSEAAGRRRKSELAKIHIGKKQLFDGDGEYRAMLRSLAGVRSAADLDEAGRRAVLEHLKTCGAEFRPVRKSGLKLNPPKPPPGTESQVRKIRAMLAEDADVLKHLPGMRAPWQVPGFAFLNTDFTAFIDASSGVAQGGAPKTTTASWSTSVGRSPSNSVANHSRWSVMQSTSAE